MCPMQVGTNPGLAWASHLLAWLSISDSCVQHKSQHSGADGLQA